jgi:hypothetical protein
MALIGLYINGNKYILWGAGTLYVLESGCGYLYLIFTPPMSVHPLFYDFSPVLSLIYRRI